jgi:hypothetical protein
MKTISVLLFLFGSLFARDYVVKTYDNNLSKGLWQMVGVLGLRDYSIGSSQNNSDSTSSDPLIPEEDTGGASTTTTSTGVYDESGFSADSLEIYKFFDINLSDNGFTKLNADKGELSIYQYNGILADPVWSYYNSNNEASTNDFDVFKKGKGYWARYNDKTLEFENNSTYLSNSGFIFNDDYHIGLTTYTGKIFEGWNLLSLPEKRTIEVVQTLLIDFDDSRDYNLTIGFKDDLDKIKINIPSDTNISAFVNTLNKELKDFHINSIANNDSRIIFFSKYPFMISDETNLTTYLIANKLEETTIEGNQTVTSEYVQGVILKFNQQLLAKLDTVYLNVNGTDINVSKRDLTKNNIYSINLTVLNSSTNEEENITAVFSKDNFYIQNNNYIKHYEYNGSDAPDGFYSLDDNQTIFQMVEDRTAINSDYTLLQNSLDYEIIQGYKDLADIEREIIFDSNNNMIFPNLLQASKYIATYSFPKTDNLKYFVSKIFEGYRPTQVLTLKTEPTINGDWNSMPIANNLTTWTSFISRYDLTFNIDKRKTYWVKFEPYSTSAANLFAIDASQTSISKNVTHQLSKDNTTITNIIHYDLQIFLQNLLKKVRGYLTINNVEVDLKPEINDGSLLTAKLDYEDLYKISNLNLVESIKAVVIDEDGNERTISLPITFKKPEKPSSLLKLDDIIGNGFYRIYQTDLSDLQIATSMYPNLCNDMGVSTVFVVKADTDDHEISTDEIILSDPIKITYASVYKNTSELISSETVDVKNPFNYDDSCNKISETTGDNEGVTIGASPVQISLFYKKSSDFSSDNLTPPKIMYVSFGDSTLEIKFDQSYNQQEFYIIDSDGNIYQGNFIPELYINDSSSLSLSKI